MRFRIGNSGETGFGAGSLGPQLYWVEDFIKWFVRKIGNSAEDSAKTQVYLGASKEIREKDMHGQYWTPVFSWGGRFVRCRGEEVSALARNEEEQKKLWAFSENAMERAGAAKRAEERVY